MIFAILFLAPASYAQSATVDWIGVHQIIDGFGASDALIVGNMSPANQSFFFGRGDGQLGLSILRVEVTDGNVHSAPGDCSHVSVSCAGSHVGDMEAAIAHGARIYATPWSPPAEYKTNGSIDCTAASGNGALATADYHAYATWLANFVKSLRTEYSISLYALSIQNEPNFCEGYDSALWTSSQIKTFVADYLGPTFSADGLSTLIFLPETGNYRSLASYAGACGRHPSCYNYVGGINWHDYDASYTAPDTVNDTPYPSGWPTGKKYWQTEASCFSGGGPSACQPGFNTNMTDALMWAAIIDQRIAVDNANAWLYWWLVANRNTDDSALMAKSGTIAKRAYVLGQYSKFVRPGYYRIDATHTPQAGISVSAYENSPGTLVIIATNYTAAAVSQTFQLANAPVFASVTPYITSATQNIAAEPAESVSKNSFTYMLPADSVTTFVATSAIAAIPDPPTNLQVTVN